MSLIIHRNDNGIVDCLILNDGTMGYECRKCRRLWRSKETSQEELSKTVVTEFTEFFAEVKRAPEIASRIGEIQE